MIGGYDPLDLAMGYRSVPEEIEGETPLQFLSFLHLPEGYRVSYRAVPWLSHWDIRVTAPDGATWTALITRRDAQECDSWVIPQFERRWSEWLRSRTS